MGGSELEKESCVNKPRERFLLSILNTLSATPEARPGAGVKVKVDGCMQLQHFGPLERCSSKVCVQFSSVLN
jgi:hypothetical protein